MRQVRHQEKPAPRPNESKMIGDMQKDPNKHYVLIEKPSTAVPGYRPDYSSYKQKGYQKESEDPTITGRDELELWSVDKDAFNQQQRADEAQALAFASQTSTDGSERVETGSAMSIRQLEASIKNH